MGLALDESVPPGVKLAFTARHFLNMRFEFPPTPGYEMLRQIAQTFAPDNVFCWTSNVDGCFERSGFDPKKVYTTQGEMNKFQCANPACLNVWDVVSQLRAVDAASTGGVLSDLSLAPACPKCGTSWPNTKPNLRGGDWFIHTPYEETSARMMAWLDNCVARAAKVAIIEVGVGGNTPIVTRIPACAFASAVHSNGGRVSYLRINPDPPERGGQNPVDGVRFHRWRMGWRALETLAPAVAKLRTEHKVAHTLAPSTEPPWDSAQAEHASELLHSQEALLWKKSYHDILESLRTPRSSK